MGYKLHLDVADGEIPISYVLTSAWVNDMQVAIPLAKMSAQRVDSCYGGEGHRLQLHGDSRAWTPTAARADHPLSEEGFAETGIGSP